MGDNCAPVITDSAFSDNGGYGIYASGSSLTITKSTMRNNTEHGLYLSASSLSIADSTLSDNGGYGMYASGSSPTITKSTMRNNTDHGLYLSASSSNITDSIFSDNGGYGISVNSNSSPIFRRNRIENNQSYGIYINGGFPNLGEDDPMDQGENIIIDNDGGNYQVFNNTQNVIYAYNNYWGYNTEFDIDKHIYDDDETKELQSIVLFNPWLGLPPRSLFIINEVDKMLAAPGSILLHTITFSNNGDWDATDVVIECILSPDVMIVEESIPNDGEYDPVGHRIIWNIPSLPAGSEPQEIDFISLISESVSNGDRIVNTARISCKEFNGMKDSTVTVIGSPVISGISPNVGSNTGDVTVKINGMNLDPKAFVSLIKSDEEEIPSLSVTGSDDGTFLYATFYLNNANPEICDIKVTNPGLEYAILESAFQIIEDGGGKLSVDVIGPGTIRVGRPAAFNVVVKNEGTTDLIDVKVDIEITEAENVQDGQNSDLSNSSTSYQMTIPKIPPGDFAKILQIFTASQVKCYKMEAEAEAEEEDDCDKRRKIISQIDFQMRVYELLYFTLMKFWYDLDCHVAPDPPFYCDIINSATSNLSNIILPTLQKALLLECSTWPAKCGPPPLACFPITSSAGIQSASVSNSSNTQTAEDYLVFCAVGPGDPNFKSGARGWGTAGYIKPLDAINYTVYFENKPEARALTI